MNQKVQFEGLSDMTDNDLLEHMTTTMNNEYSVQIAACLHLDAMFVCGN